MTLPKVLAALGLVVLLAGCGGGGRLYKTSDVQQAFRAAQIDTSVVFDCSANPSVQQTCVAALHGRPHVVGEVIARSYVGDPMAQPTIAPPRPLDVFVLDSVDAANRYDPAGSGFVRIQRHNVVVRVIRGKVYEDTVKRVLDKLH
jgi:hypothetical protein